MTARPAQVLTSRYLQTNVTVLALDGAGTLVVDSPYFPDELERLRGMIAEPVRLFATHAHYDHVMGRLAFPDAPLLAGPETAEAIARDPGGLLEDLRNEDARTYVRRAARLDLGGARPVTGLPQGVHLIRADGHAADGTALHLPDQGVLCCGDYLSDVEIPLVSRAGSLPGYRATLDRLEHAIATLNVPGHGSPADAETARRRLEQDRAYLELLAGGDEDQPLPPGRDDPRQREIHRANLERHV